MTGFVNRAEEALVPGAVPVDPDHQRGAFPDGTHRAKFHEVIFGILFRHGKYMGEMTEFCQTEDPKNKARNQNTANHIMQSAKRFIKAFSYCLALCVFVLSFSDQYLDRIRPIGLLKSFGDIL